MRSPNTIQHPATVSRTHRELQNGHKAVVLWFTGLSGAGKSTLAQAVDERLNMMGYHSFVLDGDNVRHGLCGNLGFSDDDRKENIRRIGEVSKLFLDAGIITLTAFISPFREDRDNVRALIPEGDFIEIYCSAPLEVCESRDVKGLYKKARDGHIKDFTGISSPYEPPDKPELIVETGHQPLHQCCDEVIRYLQKNAILPLSQKRAI